MKLSGNVYLLNLHSLPRSHCQFRFCLLTQLSTSPGPERLLRVLKILTNTDKTFTRSTSRRIFPLQSHILFWIVNAERRTRLPTLLNLAGSWSPYQLLHVLLAVVVIHKFSGCKGGMSSERLIPVPAALHGGLSNLVYRLGADYPKANKAATKPSWIYNLPPDSQCLNASPCLVK